MQPDALADVGGVVVTEPVPAADGPDQRGVLLHQCVPGLLIAVSGADHQVGGHTIIARRVSEVPRPYTGAAAGALAALAPPLHRCHRGCGPGRAGRCSGAGWLSSHDLVLLMTASTQVQVRSSSWF